MSEAFFGGGARTASLLNDVDLKDPMVVASMLIFTPVSIAYCDNIMIMFCCYNSFDYVLLL